MVVGMDSLRLQLSRWSGEHVSSARQSISDSHKHSTASCVGLKNTLQVDTGPIKSTNDCHYLAGVDWDQRTRKRGVYKIVGKGHKGWSPNVDKELGNYDYLVGSDVGLSFTSSSTRN